MALAKKCDRCGKLYEHYPKGATIQYNTVIRVQVTDSGLLYHRGSDLHLCEECMDKFDKFMTNGGKFDAT